MVYIKYNIAIFYTNIPRIAKSNFRTNVLFEKIGYALCTTQTSAEWPQPCLRRWRSDKFSSERTGLPLA